MGFSISWMAVSGKSKDEILESLSFVDTDEEDEVNESPVSGAQLPGGWYVIFFNDVLHPDTQPAKVQRLSKGCKILVCQIEEHVMTSTATMYENGVPIWSVVHDAQSGIYHLEQTGAPPSALDRIHAEMKASQDEEGGADADVDMLFDVPLMLAAEICGYRHDECELASGEEPAFTALVPAYK